MINASSKCPMERCDASIFAGGGDVWSGKRRTGGRYAGPAAYGTSNMNFTGATRTVAARLMDNLEMEQVMRISEWPIMGKVSTHGEGFGGFFGYTSQWS